MSDNNENENNNNKEDEVNENNNEQNNENNDENNTKIDHKNNEEENKNEEEKKNEEKKNENKEENNNNNNETIPNIGTNNNKDDIFAYPRSLRVNNYRSLEQYETIRRNEFKNKIQSNRYYWKGFTSLLSNSSKENTFWMNFIIHKINLEREYIEKLSLFYNGTLLFPQKNEKKNNLLFNKTNKNNEDEMQGNLIPSSPMVNADDIKKRRSSSNKQSNQTQNNELIIPEENHLPLRLLLEMHQSHAKRIDEFASLLESKEMKVQSEALIKRFSEESSAIVHEGGEILNQMFQCERDVKESFHILQKSVSKFIKNKNNNENNEKNNEGEEEDKLNLDDQWLHEMRYRTLVIIQDYVWQNGVKKLRILFQRAKDLEIHRRTNLFVLVRKFLHYQNQFFHALPPISTTTQEEVQQKALTNDSNELEKSIVQYVQKKAKIFREEHDKIHHEQHNITPIQASDISLTLNEGKSMNTSEIFNPNITDNNNNEESNKLSLENYKLASPLDSPLIIRAGVLYRKIPGMFTKWKLTLVCITKDKKFHLFDISNDIISKKNQNVEYPTSHEVFDSLVNDICQKQQELSSSNNHIDRRRSSTSLPSFLTSSLFQNLIPLVTLNINLLSVSFKPNISDSSFEIIETKKNIGFKSIFKTNSTKEYTFKAKDQEDMVDWCVSLKIH